MDVTISIVSYNTSDLLKRCLTSIYQCTNGVKFEIIVVDNNSKDDSLEMVTKEFPEVILIANKKNNYFSKANNQALRIAKGKYFLLLNSDTFFVDNSIDRMIAYLEKHKEIGALEGLELYEDGKILSTGSGFSTPLIDFYELSLVGIRIKNKKLIDTYRLVDKNRKKTYPIDVGCDAFLCVPTELMRKIKGYDEKLLLYYTENDLCLRIKKIGYSIIHHGNVKVMHRVSASANKLGWRKNDIYYQDLLTYYKKYGYPVKGALLYFLLKTEEAILKLRELL